MKKFLTILMGLFLTLGLMQSTALADTEEMRGAWISTVSNLDWPSTGARNNVTQQKQEFISMLDTLQNSGINSVFVQIRPNGDALYSSNINVWSSVLTGTQGKDPGYDPLAFMIEETHKRGMEFHAWMNPYRASNSTGSIYDLHGAHPARMNPSWSIEYDGQLYFDPGNPEVIQYIVDTVSEVVSNYNIDGIHFDDYFYPASSFNDSTSYTKYGNGMNKDDWRRNNVNTLVKRVHDEIKNKKSVVQFGIGPFGIWKNSSSDPAGSETRGNQSYYAHYADSVAWIKNGWIDYIAPQLYWTFGNSAAPYGVLVDWWANQVAGTDVKLYVGQALYKDGSSSYPENVVAEIEDQIAYNRTNSEVDGSIYFRAKNITTNSNLQSRLKNINVINHSKLVGNTRYETSVSVSKSGWSTGADTVFIVNGYANADGITATPLASAYNAPILLSEANTLVASTKAEISRLNPSKVILIGGTTVLSDNLISQIKSINSGIQVERIGGSTRFDTSLLIAQRLDTIVDVSKAYVCYGLGEPDALSIASKAGEEKIPIILSNRDSVPASTLNWLKGEGLSTAYFIGGTTVLYDNVINQINNITSNNVSSNRIAGADRYDTNAQVIKTFYTNAQQNAVIATKGLVLADALTAGPLASKIGAPVVLVEGYLRKSQKQVLTPKQANKIYEIGGGINSSAINDLINRLR